MSRRRLGTAACCGPALLCLAGPTPSVRVADPIGEAIRACMVWDADDRNTPTSVAFRGTVSLASKPRSAKLHIFADARYMLWLNGRYVARGPNRFDPQRPEYDTHDVAAHLIRGRNVLAVLVHGRLSNYRFINHTPGLGIVLALSPQPSALSFRPASLEWRCGPRTRFAPPTVLLSGIADTVDETLDDGDWTATDYDDTGWRPAVPVPGTHWGELQPRAITLLREEPVKGVRIVSVTGSDAPVGVGTPVEAAMPIVLRAPASLLVDAGMMVRAGFEVEFEPEGPSASVSRLPLNPARPGGGVASGGAEFTLRPRQSDTDRDAGYLGSCRYRASTRTGRRTFRTTDDFTCRLVQLDLLQGSITLHGLRVIERRYPFDRVGSFRCSDPFLNELWDMAMRTAEVNAVDAYIDGSEGGEWVTGHIDYPVTEVAFAAAGPKGKPVYSDPRLLMNQLSRMALTQEGDRPLRAWHPTDWNLGPRDMERGIHNFIEDSSAIWVSLLRVVYDATADRAFVDRLWPVAERLLQWFLDRRTERGLVHAREFYLHFDNPIAYHDCEGATLNAFVYRALSDAAYLARATGRPDNADRYASAAKALKDAYNRRLWDASSGTYFAGLKDGEKRMLTRWPDPSLERYYETVDQSGPTFPPTPQAAGMALWAGLVPEDRLRPVRRYLMQHHGELLSPVSYLFAFEAVYAMDTPEADLEALNTMRRRWATMVGRKMPGTLGEQFGDESYYCHDFGPIPAAFLAGRVLGVRRDGPVGRKRIVIEPRLGDLTEAEGVVCTRYGPVGVSWRRDAGGLTFELDVPRGVTAELLLPVADRACTITLDGRVVKGTLERGRRAIVVALRAGKHSGTVSRAGRTRGYTARGRDGNRTSGTAGEG